MKVVIGPLNIASQPYYLAKGLREYGVDAVSLAYNNSVFAYDIDHRVELPRNPAERIKKYYEILKDYLENDYDIFHFFQRPFFMADPPEDHCDFLGFEIPLLKARGKHVAYRFTGWELIDRELEIQNNPHSAFHHGWNGAFNPKMKQEFLNFLKCYCDAFMVVDPMMKEHCPEAEVVPRLLPVKKFEEIGIEKKTIPLILHAPSNAIYKGSKFILKALKDLKNEGVRFDLKLLKRVPFGEAMEWYKKADIIIDQVLIGWYGVLATECMAMGKPVAVYMREDLVKTPEEVPIHNINPDNIKERLRILINDYALREELAQRGRAYVESIHDTKVVIPKLISVYKKIKEQPKTEISNYDDIEYLMMQRIELDKQRRLFRVAITNKSNRVISRLKREINNTDYRKKWLLKKIKNFFN